MKVQDKAIEAIVGSGTPEDDWLDDTHGYKVRKTHLELLGLASLRGEKILDAGCGPGTYGIMLAQAGNEVVGIEISAVGAQVANQRARQKGVNFTARVGDLEDLQFDDNTFDVCFCGWVLHHFPNIKRAVSELVRVLKPGGIIALAEPNESNLAIRFSRFIEDLPPIRKWVLKEGWDTPNRTINKHTVYVQMLAQNGITDIKVSSCFPGGLPPLPPKSRKSFKAIISLLAIKLMVHSRRLIFSTACRILPRPLNGADLLIRGNKLKPTL
jgi:2-polyprenyl-3-methyl-5-hydroxy-6-metoxy-1,4-benzoquinol methylase